MSDQYEYFNSEEELKAYQAAQEGTPHGRKVIESLFPGVRVTSDYRPPSHELSQKNPNSYHKKSDRAVDIAAIPGMTFEDVAKKIKDAGYDILEMQDEYKNPSKNATGNHWHFVIGDQYEYFNSEEELKAAQAKQGVNAPEEPVQREPDYQPLQTAGGEKTITTGAETAQQSDIEKMLRQGAAAKVPFEKIGETIEGKYPGQIAKEGRNLKWYYDHYSLGGNSPINWTADKNRVGENNDPNTITVEGDLADVATYQEELTYLKDRALLAASQGSPAAAYRGIRRALGTPGEEVNQDKAEYEAELQAQIDASNAFGNPIIREVGGFIPEAIAGAGPEDLIPVFGGATKAGRVAGAVGVNMATDAGLQGIEIAQGSQDAFSPERNLISGALGGGLQAGGELLVSLAKKYDGLGVGVTEKSGKVVEVSDSPAPSAAPVIKGRTREGSPKDQKVRTVSDIVAKTTEGWTNAPEIVVYTNIGALAKAEPKIAAAMKSDGAAKAPGFYGEDGRVHIIADNVTPDRVQSLVFHEALAHDGLAKEFGDELASKMSMVYDRNWRTRRNAGNLAMKGYGETYASTPQSRAAVKAAMKLTNAGERRRAIEAAIENDPRMKALLAEEVLAKMSEEGPLSKSLLDKLAVTIRNYARKMGLDLDLSAREVKSIIAEAHQRVISGEGKAAPSGMKYMRVYHGSGADFDKFDMEKVGTGEGAQVYGHGLYFTETRSIAQQYKNKIGAWTNPMDDNPGKLYEVDLPDDMKWLAWDFQPTDAEKAALKKLGIEYADKAEVRKLYEEFYVAQQKMINAEDAIQELRTQNKQFASDATEQDKRFGRKLSPDYEKQLAKLRDAETAVMFLQSEIDGASPHGELIYKKLVDKYGSAPKASKALEEAGFDGVKYLDGFSRDYGEGSYNYVVFDDKKPTIVNKYALNDTELTQRTVDKFMKAMKGVRRQREDYAERVKVNRSEKTKKGFETRSRVKGEKGFYAVKSSLKGEVMKPVIEPLREKFSQREIDKLFDFTTKHPELTFWQGVRAGDGLKKLLEGGLPEPAQLDLLGRVFGRDFVRYALDLRKRGEKIKDWVQEGVGLQRAMISSIDFSAPFRQAWGMMGRKAFWKNLLPMFKQGFSKDFHNQVMLSIEEHPYYDLSQKAGLFLAEMGSDLNAREENYSSKLADKIPGVVHSNMAYTGFLNKVRFDTFVDMVDKYGSFKDPNLRVDLTDPENLSIAKQLAKHLNVFTGRGSLGAKFESAAPFLSIGLFSPRLMASRINMLFNGVNLAYWWNLHPVARREVAQDYAKMAAITASTIGLIKYAFSDDENVDVELDMRSSDFGKIRIGERRYDILGGLGQYMVLVARLGTGETKTIKGEVKELSKKTGQTELDVFGRFIRNKLAPIPGYIATAGAGEDPVGEEFEPAKDGALLFAPLFLQDLYKGFEDEGFVGAAAALPSLVGFGYSKYATVPSKHDAYGRTFAESKKKDSVVEELDRLQKEENLPIPLVELATNTNLPKSFRKLEDPKPLEMFQELSGKYIMDNLRELTASEEWRTMTNEDKIDAVRKVKKTARKQARDELFGEAE